MSAGNLQGGIDKQKGHAMIIQMFDRQSECKCSKCGKDIPRGGYLAIKNYTMPYGSKYDYDILNLTLCVGCLDNLIEGCVINPVTKYDDSEKFGL